MKHHSRNTIHGLRITLAYKFSEFRISTRSLFTHTAYLQHGRPCIITHSRIDSATEIAQQCAIDADVAEGADDDNVGDGARPDACPSAPRHIPRRVYTRLFSTPKAASPCMRQRRFHPTAPPPMSSPSLLHHAAAVLE